MHFEKSTATVKTAAILAGAILALSLTAATLQAQQATPPPAQPPAADDNNSFPSDVSHKAASDKKKAEAASPDAPDATDQNTAPATPASAPPASGTDGNAFPEETSRKAAAAAKADTSSGIAADVPDNPGVSSSGDYDRRTAGRNAVPTNVPMPHVNGKDPVKEDINVGGYYLESGNFAGAYLRFKEAVTLAPENADAMFGLAEAARHLKKRDEALTNYQLFLQIVDSGSKARDARKAVASLEKAR